MGRVLRLTGLTSMLIWTGLSGFALAQSTPPAAPITADDSHLSLPTAVTERAPAAASGARPVTADGPPVERPMAVLVLDVDQAYESSAWGRRAKAEIEAAAREIEADNRRLEAQLTSEEQALTAERVTLAPDAFRRKAEEFDARAQTIRRERAQVARDLGSRAEADRNAFLNASLPAVTALMQEHQAAVVLDRGQTLLAATSIDITTQLVERMDATVGAGSGLPGPGGSAPEDAAAQAKPPARDADADGKTPAAAPAPDAPTADGGTPGASAPDAPSPKVPAPQPLAPAAPAPETPAPETPAQ
ncbi:OmpH family outer membrane protein [Paracoccus sp. S1E-3]|uniref:OmpH family outer membrane protein n=1 Tax=Paracoccus sp. S1E-3 TaxID=2756130 RepID=UPI0015EF5EA0|nr:OmpH family outer membrane protein [Paracoccus sp. S1E-3]MBA4489728.1 OmpH family outer membrane protein [Paracoccus sp. S1E-3]